MNFNEIVADWLITHGYDGLYHADTCCGCGLDDLMPCGAPGENCEPGYVHLNEPCLCGGGCTWAVFPDPPAYDAEVTPIEEELEALAAKVPQEEWERLPADLTDPSRKMR